MIHLPEIERLNDKIKSLEVTVDLLTDQSNFLDTAVSEAHRVLTKLGVPTNGRDANGELGVGKRETLTLLQRLTFVRYERK